MGIIGKIWNVGSSGGSTKNLNSSIDYITNDEKCDYEIRNNLSNEVDYVSDYLKTVKGAYIGYKHVLEETAVSNEMMAVKSFYGKDTGRSAIHGIISLDEDESDIGNASKLMLLCSEFLDKVYAQHQAIFAVHTNTENMHVHFIVNTVGLDGKKLHMGKDYIRTKFQPELNRLAKKYGFKPNMEFEHMEKDLVSLKDRKIYLREQMDLAIEKSDNFSEMIDFLRNRDIKVNVGKHLSLKAKGMQKAMRTYQLGTEYTIDSVKRRIMEKREPFDIYDTSSISVARTDVSASSYVEKTLKRYKDLGEEEKKEVVKLLRQGRNPWMETYKDNWMIKKLDDELNDKERCVALIKHYAPNSCSVKAAMKEILKKQEMIEEDIKELNQIRKRYRVQFKLVDEAKSKERTAYLYETTRDEAYFSDYTDYILIRSRLKDNYDKELEEVAEYKEELEGNKLYLKAQLKELKSHYKILYKHVNRDNNLSLFEAIGHSKAREDAYYKGIYVTDEKYISDKDSEYIVQVIQRPGVVKGKNTIVTELNILDRDNNFIEKIDSSTMDGKEFNKEIKRIAKDYSLKKCQTAKTRAQIQSI